MYRYPLIFAVVVILLIVGVFAVFGGHKGAKPTSTSTSQIQPLPNYSTTDAEVSMTIDGQINGDDAHRAIKITISANQRDMDIIQGYSGTVINHQQFYNTGDAYNVFLRAINYEGFLLPLKDSKYPADERGECSNGDRYIFELNQEGRQLSRLWASSCGSKIGTFGGNSQLVQNLFEAQITNYEDTANSVNL